MLQVSADVHVPVRPDAAQAAARRVGEPDLHVPPHVHDGRVGWRFDHEGDGTLVVLTFGYAVEPGWVRRITTEVTQWSLARQLRAHLERVQDACAAEREG